MCPSSNLSPSVPCRPQRRLLPLPGLSTTTRRTRCGGYWMCTAGAVACSTWWTGRVTGRRSAAGSLGVTSAILLSSESFTVGTRVDRVGRLEAPVRRGYCHGSWLSCLFSLCCFSILSIRLELLSICGEVCPANHLAGLNRAITSWLQIPGRGSAPALCDSCFLLVHTSVLQVVGQLYSLFLLSAF